MPRPEVRPPRPDLGSRARKVRRMGTPSKPNARRREFSRYRRYEGAGGGAPNRTNAGGPADTWVPYRIRPPPRGARLCVGHEVFHPVEVVGEPQHGLFSLRIPAFQPIEKIMIGKISPFGAALPLGAVERTVRRSKAPGPIQPGLRDLYLIDARPQRFQPLGETFGQPRLALRDPGVE